MNLIFCECDMQCLGSGSWICTAFLKNQKNFLLKNNFKFFAQIWILGSNKLFLQYLVDIVSLGSGPVDPHMFADPDPGSQNLADPTDPYSKHCFFLFRWPKDFWEIYTPGARYNYIPSINRLSFVFSVGSFYFVILPIHKNIR